MHPQQRKTSEFPTISTPTTGLRIRISDLGARRRCKIRSLPQGLRIFVCHAAYGHFTVTSLAGGGFATSTGDLVLLRICSYHRHRIWRDNGQQPPLPATWSCCGSAATTIPEFGGTTGNSRLRQRLGPVADRQPLRQTVDNVAAGAARRIPDTRRWRYSDSAKYL